jgi:cell wall-associated NlpC family hydrolase
MRTPPFRHARARAAGAAAFGMCAALVLPPVGAAFATPGVRSGPAGSRISTVQRDLSALTQRIGVEVEKYDNARIALAAAQRRAAAAHVAADRARKVYLTKRATLSRFAASAYQTGPNGQIAAVVSSSPAEYLDKISTLDVVAQRGTEIVSAVDVARLRYAGQVATAQHAARAALQVTQSIAASKASIESQIATQRRILNGLQAEQARLERLAAQQKAARNAAAQRTVAAARQITRVTQSMTGGSSNSRRAATTRPTAIRPRNTRPTNIRTHTTSAPRVSVSVSGRGGAAVAAAESVLGRPYVWGASGQSSFDCSGLTMWAWAHAGVGLSHSSSAQYGSGAQVSQSALQPGDLLFFYSPISHVGMYIGGGQMIHAPHTGDVVRIATPMWSDFVGAVRPG